MAKAAPLPDWAKVGARFVVAGRWGIGSELYTVTRVTEKSAWAVPDGTKRRESRWVASPYDESSVVAYGADRWDRTWGHWVESKQGKIDLAAAEEQVRRRRVKAAFDKLHKDWTVEDAVLLQDRLTAWIMAQTYKEADDGAGKEV